MAFRFTLMEPIDMVRARHHARIGGGSRDQSFQCHPLPKDWRPVPKELASVLHLPESARCFGVRLPPIQTRLSDQSPVIQHPCMLWNGSNRIRMDRPSEEYKNIPLWFELVLLVPPRQNKELTLLRSCPETQGTKAVYAVPWDRVQKQEAWVHTGPAIVLRVALVCSANPAWKLVLVMQKTVRASDGEPLLLFADRMYALVELLVVYSPGE